MRRERRDFTTERAVRRGKPVYFGIFGPSGGGKTFSALRVAKGIQSVVGGNVVVIDTENGRALDYADHFDFEHMDFQPPFGSLDYLDAFRSAVKLGGSVIVCDSMSHEHEGPGGLLDAHEQELDRMAGNDWQKRERVKMLAWQEPKKHRRALLQWVARSPVNLVCCYRAKETAKPVVKDGKTQVVQMGFDPIAGDEFVYEMTAATLLLPAAGGVPTWRSEMIGERQMIKLPAQFRDLFLNRGEKPLDESVGRALAEWARGPVSGGGGRGESTASGKVPAAASVEPAPAAADPLRAEALEAARDALRLLGAKNVADAKRLAADAGVAPERAALGIEALTTDELTMIADRARRAP